MNIYHAEPNMIRVVTYYLEDGIVKWKIYYKRGLNYNV